MVGGCKATNRIIMKNQDEKFILKRDKIRKIMIMTRMGLKNQAYQKLMGQKTNGNYDQPLNDSEVIEFDFALANAQKVIKEMRKELKR